MRSPTLPLLALLPLVFAPITHAGLLVHEPFAYPADSSFPDYASGNPEAVSQPASLGGTGLSLQPRPSRDRDSATIAKTGLSYKDSRGRVLRTSGLSAIIPEGSSTVFNLYTTHADDPFAKLRNPAEPRELGKPGETVWLSFLVMAATEPAAEHSFSLRFSGTKTSFPIGLHSRRSSGIPTFGAISSAGGAPVEPRKAHFIVLRLVLGENGAAEMWVNPDLGGERPSAEPNPRFEKVPVFLRSLWFNKTSNGELPVAIDELRIGETFADVAPVL